MGLQRGGPCTNRRARLLPGCPLAATPVTASCWMGRPMYTVLCSNPCGPKSCPRPGTSAARLRSNSELGRNRPKLVEVGPMLANIGQVWSESAEVGRAQPSVADFGPDLAKLCPIFVEIRKTVNSGRIRQTSRTPPNDVELGPISAELVPNVANIDHVDRFGSHVSIYPHPLSLSLGHNLHHSAKILRTQRKPKRPRQPLFGHQSVAPQYHCQSCRMRTARIATTCCRDWIQMRPSETPSPLSGRGQRAPRAAVTAKLRDHARDIAETIPGREWHVRPT